ncbi:MAG: hypothetical protein JXB07_17175 [Anaerolineae bacterium]|nr:hypothetical protein [Anaerolineae bacterium]
MVETSFPILEVQSPDGKTFATELAKDRIMVGRFRPFNYMGLEPDTPPLVTRKAHCALVHEATAWYVAR